MLAAYLTIPPAQEKPKNGPEKVAYTGLAKDV
jgi:hypothetical protein